MKVNKINTKRKPFIAVVCLVAAIATMIFSGVGASLWGVELHAIEQEIALVEGENGTLEDEMIMHTSLTAIRESVGGDFVLPERVVYLNKEVPVLGYAK